MEKRALLIGINKYANSENNLHGCLNDVVDMYLLLTEYYGFPKDNITVITDERSTQKNILEEMKMLVGQSKTSDLAVLYYSGHGTQVRDRNGDEEDDLDECLVSYDHDWDDPLTDDKIAAIFKNIDPGARMYAMFDCCYGGSATRDMIPLITGAILAPTGLEDGQSARFLAPPLDIYLGQHERSLNLKGLFGWVKSLFKGDAPVETSGQNMNHLFMSAASDKQVSLETSIQGKTRGVFTYYLTKLLRNSTNRKESSRQIHKELVSYLKSKGYDQSPQLEGPDYLKDMLFLV